MVKCIPDMTIECKHYIFGHLRVVVTKIKEDKTVHLTTWSNPEAAQMGLSGFRGWATSLTVLTPDSDSIDTYDPNGV